MKERGKSFPAPHGPDASMTIEVRKKPEEKKESSSWRPKRTIPSKSREEGVFRILPDPQAGRGKEKVRGEGSGQRGGLHSPPRWASYKSKSAGGKGHYMADFDSSSEGVLWRPIFSARPLVHGGSTMGPGICYLRRDSESQPREPKKSDIQYTSVLAVIYRVVGHRARFTLWPESSKRRLRMSSGKALGTLYPSLQRHREAMASLMCR